MQPPAPPKITAVEVAATQSTDAASAAIARPSAEGKSVPQVAYVVKVRLKAKPPATSMAWALYVDDVLIPKYWEYKHGIYFTVLDPEFFEKHKGKPLRFSYDGIDFVDTGAKLAAPGPAAVKAKGKADRLPPLAEVLK
jgi:hypothetical protein